MKKLFGFILLSLLYCNIGLTKDLTLYCKQEVRKIFYEDGSQKTIPMKDDWEFLITTKFIKFVGYDKKYIRDKDIEEGEIYFASRIGDTNDFFSNLKIDRYSGEGFLTYRSPSNYERNLFKCSTKKFEKKKLF